VTDRSHDLLSRIPPKYSTMETNLDEPERLSALDGGGMLRVLSRFAVSCKDAIEAAEDVALDGIRIDGIDSVVVAGVGGSAIGGHILGDWLLGDCPIPIYVSRGYHLPAFVDDDTLVFAISYSGNTEETLSAFKEAVGRSCQVIAITSSGSLLKLAAEKRVTTMRIPSGVQPRASLPNQFFSLAIAMRRLGFVSQEWTEVDEAIRVLEMLKGELISEVPTASNPAKQIALGLAGLVPFVFGPRLYDGVAYRIRTQLNENGKVPSGSGSFPEAFHNAVMGCEAPNEVLRCIGALIIRDSVESDGGINKIDAFERMMRAREVKVLEIHPRGRGKLSRMLSALYVGDYAATYLGLLNGIDPSSSGSIEALKRS